MHPACRQWWTACEKCYTKYFRDPSRVIELGSGVVGGGSIRYHFQCQDYTGVDWAKRPGVDLISLAHEVPFEPESFDTVVSASMLEHDPYWNLSISKMVEIMKPDGILILTWGAAHNDPHCHAEAPDGKFHSLPAKKVTTLLEQLGLYIHDFRYDCHVTDDFSPPKKEPSYEVVLSDYRDCVTGFWRGPNHICGEVNLIAFKDRQFAVGSPYIDNFTHKDSI